MVCKLDEALETIREAIIPKGDRHIVVLDRGWIFVGNLSHDETGYTLTNCSNVRRWEEGGFGALCQSAQKAKAHLDAAATIRFAASALIFAVPISESWDA